MKRRDFLGLTVITAFMLPFRAIAAIWNQAAFNAVNTSGALRGLAISDEILSADIDIIAPKRAENGAIVQLEITSRIANTEAIAVFVENNPTALIGNYMFSHGAQPYLVTRIKMAETSDIKIVIKSGSKYYTASKKVVVLENGCGGTSSVNEQFISSMKIRARLLKDTKAVQVKAIITHPMHTGAGKDGSGQLIPAHFIQFITIKHDNQPAVEMQLGTGISKNPYLTFHLVEAKLGDTVLVEWHDNFGKSGKAKTTVIT